MDYYLFLTPFFALILLISLYVLKRTLAQLARKSSPPLIPSSESEPSYLNTFAYMMKQMTWLQAIFAPVGKLQAPTLFSLSLLAILTYYFPQCYAFALIGPFISLIFMAFRVLHDGTPEEAVDEEAQRSKATKFYLIFECLAILGYAYILAMTFRNYLNSQLQSFMLTAIINVSIEQAIASPVIYGLAAIVLCRSSQVSNYISSQQSTIEKGVVNEYDCGQQGPRLVDERGDLRQQSKVMLFQEPSCQKIGSADEAGRQEQSQQSDDYKDIMSKDEGDSIEKGTYCLNLRKETTRVDQFDQINQQLFAFDRSSADRSGSQKAQSVEEHPDKRSPLQEASLNVLMPMDYFPAEPELLFEIPDRKALTNTHKIKSTRKIRKNQGEMCIDQQMGKRPSTRKSRQENVGEPPEPKRLVTNKTSNVLKIREHELVDIEELDGAENIFNQDVRRRISHHRRDTAMTFFQDRSQKNRSEVSILSGDDAGRKLLRRGRKRKGRDKPIVHEGEEKSEVFIVNFE